MSLLRTSHLIFAAASFAAVTIPWALVSMPHITDMPYFPSEVQGGNAPIDPPPPMAAFEGRLFFGGTPQPMVADAAAPIDTATTPAPPPEPPRLVGTAISRRGRAVAVIRTAAGETRMVARGDSIDGWQVIRISDARIQIRLGGDTRSVMIERLVPTPPSPNPVPTLANISGGARQ